MRSEADIQRMITRVCDQAASVVSATRAPHAHRLLKERARTLMWVLEDPQITRLDFTDEQLKFLECLY